MKTPTTSTRNTDIKNRAIINILGRFHDSAKERCISVSDAFKPIKTADFNSWVQREIDFLKIFE